MLKIFPLTAAILAIFTGLIKAAATNPSKTVAIVGAGMAGIKAALDLRSAGYSVILLEGKSRIGGRLYSERSIFGVPVEMGVAWIHGCCKENPIFVLAEEIGVQFYPTRTMMAIGRDGSDLECPPKEELKAMVWRVFEDLKELGAKDDQSDTSVYEAFITNAPRLLESIPVKYHRCIIKVFIEFQMYFCEYWQRIGIKGLGVDDEYAGDHSLVIDGYDTILKVLLERAGGCDADGEFELKLNEFVTDVIIDGDQVIIDSLNTLSNVSTRITVDAVIITVPLGVLKSNQIRFQPALPADKQTAIRNLGFGIREKVFIEFTEKIEFWPEEQPSLLQIVPECDDDYLVAGWREASSSIAVDRMEMEINRDDDFGIYLVNMEFMTGKPLLAMLYYGQAGELVATHHNDPSFLNSFILSQLKRAFPSTTLPQIKTLLATNWHTDSQILGAYSNIPVGVDGALLMDVLAMPVADKIYFAGEATLKEHYATVHGAFLSGQRDAQRIIQHFKAQ